MSTNYTTYQQHEPFRIPSNWGAQEKKFVYQLEETFDDIYKRFGRLRLEDMGAKFRKSYEQTMEDSSMYKTEIEAGAQGITTLTTKTGINNLGVNETLYSKITQDEASWKATFRKIGASGYTAEGITEINENGVKVTHSSMNCYTQMSATGFKILDSNNNLMGGITTLNNQVVTAMSNMYNPTYPLLNMNIGAWNSAPWEGQTAQGLIFHFGNAIPAAIGLFKDPSLDYFSYEMECAGDMDLYATRKINIRAMGGKLHLYSYNGNIELIAPSSDIVFGFVYLGNYVTMTASQIFGTLYGW